MLAAANADTLVGDPEAVTTVLSLLPVALSSAVVPRRQRTSRSSPAGQGVVTGVTSPSGPLCDRGVSSLPPLAGLVAGLTEGLMLGKEWDPVPPPAPAPTQGVADQATPPAVASPGPTAAEPGQAPTLPTPAPAPATALEPPPVGFRAGAPAGAGPGAGTRGGTFGIVDDFSEEDSGGEGDVLAALQLPSADPDVVGGVAAGRGTSLPVALAPSSPLPSAPSVHPRGASDSTAHGHRHSHSQEEALDLQGHSSAQGRRPRVGDQRSHMTASHMTPALPARGGTSAAVGVSGLDGDVDEVGGGESGASGALGASGGSAASGGGAVSVQVARLRAQVWDLQTQLTAAKEREWRKGKELRADIAEAEERVFRSDKALQDVAAQLSR
jgi:hypothetical protein